MGLPELSPPFTTSKHPASFSACSSPIVCLTTEKYFPNWGVKYRFGWVMQRYNTGIAVLECLDNFFNFFSWTRVVVILVIWSFGQNRFRDVKIPTIIINIIYYYSEQMTESENENDHFDLDHFDHFRGQACLSLKVLVFIAATPRHGSRQLP